MGMALWHALMYVQSHTVPAGRLAMPVPQQVPGLTGGVLRYRDVPLDHGALLSHLKCMVIPCAEFPMF